MRVALVGNLAGVANEYLVGLRALGVEVDLFLPKVELEETLEDLRSGGEGTLRPEWLRVIPTYQRSSEHRGLVRWVLIVLTLARELPIARSLLGYDVVHCHTGALLTGRVLRLLFVVFRVRGYIAAATGSDLREVAAHDRTGRGRWMRAFFRRAKAVLLLNIDMVNVANELGLSRARFFPFAIDTTAFCPPAIRRDYTSSGRLVFFMMSRLDWATNGASARRTSANENDRVFIAFARFVREYPDTMLIVSYRGADREEAVRLVETLGISEYVRFVPPMNRSKRIEYMVSADVCLDQFGLGAYGLGALQSMACGTPLITYIEQRFVEQCGLQYPPILNARTSDEIFDAMRTSTDPRVRERLGTSGREWVVNNHGREKVSRLLLKVYAAQTKAVGSIGEGRGGRGLALG